MAQTPVLLANATVIDGTGAAPELVVFLLEGQRFTGVGEEARARAAAGAPVRELDLGGCTLMPGLIDSHCHISFDEPSSNDELFFHRRYGLATLVASVNAQKVLRAGFTSFFDADCIFDVGVDLRDAIEGGVVPGPRMTTGGNVLIIRISG